MANIQTYLNKIKNAIYGRDVRDSIHDAIDAINTESENTKDIIEDFVGGELDTTLTSTTLPAQGKAVGDAVDNLIKSDLNNRLQQYDNGILSVKLDFATSYGFIGSDGSEQSAHSSGQRKTSYVDVSNIPALSIVTRYAEPITAWVAIATYDSNQTFINRIAIVNNVANTTETNDTFTIPSNVSYVRVMFSSFDVGVVNVYALWLSQVSQKIGEFCNYYENLNFKGRSGINEVTQKIDVTSCISKPIPIDNSWSGSIRFDGGRVGNDFAIVIYDSNDTLIAWRALSGANDSQTRDITITSYPTAAYVQFSYDKNAGGKVTILNINKTVWEPKKANYSIVEKNTLSIENLNLSMQIAENKDVSLPTNNFTRGNLVNGKPISIIYRVISISPYIFSFPIVMVANTGYKFGVHSYDENGVFVADSGWKTSYIVPANTPFNFVIAKTIEDMSLTADVPTFVNAIKLNVSKYSADTENLYFGDKIVLNNDSTTQHSVNITLWKDFVGDEIPSLASYSLHLNQSMTIYGGYVFLFSPGICTILDYSTKNIVGSCNYEPASHQHANSAQFTDMYYASDDEFPLLLLSRCGNSASGSGYDECLIYRITRSESTFTMTLVNDIMPNFATYGASWGIDNNTGLLYMSTTINGTWQVTENNPIMFSAYKMPTLTEILSSNEILIDKDDVIAKMLIPHYTLQGMAVNGGIIYTGITYNGHNVWAADIWNNRVKSKIKLTSNYEVEGVAVYDGKIYVSQKIGTDTEAVNPCKIYELSFDDLT